MDVICDQAVDPFLAAQRGMYLARVHWSEEKKSLLGQTMTKTFYYNHQ